MRVVPAEQHTDALIAWLGAIHKTARRRTNVKRECNRHVQRLQGHPSKVWSVDEPRLLTPARASAWLREHVAAEPASLLRGVVT